MILLKLLWVICKLFVKEVQGLENIPKGQFILAANHSSLADAALLISLFSWKEKEVRFFATNSEKYRTWWWNWWFNYVKAIRINGSLKKGLEAAKNGDLIGIFPEGRMTPNGKIQKPGGKGVGVMALKCKLPVLPIKMNTFWWWPKHNKHPTFKKNILIKIGKPIKYEKKYSSKNAEDVTKDVMNRIKKI